MLDKYLFFDENAEHLTTSGSTNVIDLNHVRNIAAGHAVYVESLVKEAMDDATSESTMTLTVETDDNESFSSPTSLQTIGTFEATSAAGTKLSVALAITDSYQRFIRLKYTVANGNLTAGKFSSYLTLLPSVNRVYADGIA